MHNKEQLQVGWKQYRNIRFNSLLLSTDIPNNTVKIHDNIYVIKNILKNKDSFFLKVRKYLNKEEFYNVGFSSCDVGIHLCFNLQSEPELFNINEISKKCFRIRLPKSELNYEICNVNQSNKNYVVIEI